MGLRSAIEAYKAVQQMAEENRMKQQKKFVPDRFVNRINFRVPRRTISIMPSSPMEASFDTWDAAKEFLLKCRRAEVAQAERALVNARSRLRKAISMSEHAV